MSITLISSDGRKFGIPYSYTYLSGLLTDLSTEEDMPMNDIDGDTLERIVKFFHMYNAAPMPEIEKPIRSNDFANLVPKEYNEFMLMENEELFKLATGANYMDIKPLLDLTCAKIATMIKDKSSQEIRTIFSIENDMTPEEEEAIREEYKWCEE